MSAKVGVEEADPNRQNLHFTPLNSLLSSLEELLTSLAVRKQLSYVRVSSVYPE